MNARPNSTLMDNYRYLGPQQKETLASRSTGIRAIEMIARYSPTIIEVAVNKMTSVCVLASLPNQNYIDAIDLNIIKDDFMSMFPPDPHKDLFEDGDLGDILKNIKDKFGKKLKPEDIKYYEKMETAFLSESALAKDWMTPEEDEAWKDL